MARKTRTRQDIARGNRFGEIVEKIYPNQKSRNARAKEMGFDEKSLRDWEAGANIDNWALAAIIRHGGSIDYLLLGDGEPLVKNAPQPDSGETSKGAANPAPDPADASFVQLIALLTELHTEAKTNPAKRAEWAAVLRDFLHTAEKSLRAG